MRGHNILRLTLLVAALLCGENGVHCRKAQKVIIVGAGAAGLAAGAKLVQTYGFLPSQITILEAENRIGGRINTVDYGAAKIELGAQFCHGTDSVTYKIANPAGLLHTELPQTEESTGWADNVQPAYPNTGRTLTQQQWLQYRGVADQIYSSANTALIRSTLSLGTYFNQTFPKYLGKKLSTLDNTTAWDLLNWDDRAQGIETACPTWFNISGSRYVDYQDPVGYEDITWKNGFSSLFPVLLKGVNINAMIRYNSTVTSIFWKPNAKLAAPRNTQVVVTTSNGQVYTADIVLVTVSVGVLKKKYTTMFTPALPSYKINAIKYLGFGTVDKIFLVFKAPWWNRSTWGGVSFLTAPVNRTNTWISRLLGFYTMRDQPNMLIGWLASADTSYGTMNEAQLLSNCSKLLRGAIGKQFPNYADPIGLIRSNWNSNPNFLGSYSYHSLETAANKAWGSDLFYPEQDDYYGSYRLLFAGEATNDNFYSTVNAAITTGYAQADNINKYTYA